MAPSVPKIRRKGWLVVLTCLVLAVVAESTARAVAPRLATSVTLWNDWEATTKVNAMDALARRRGNASIVLVGSSQMDVAGDPAALSSLLGVKRQVFNASLAGMDAQLMEVWVLRVVVPRLHPRAVVIGVSSRDLNDLYTYPAFNAITSSYEARLVSNGLSPTKRILTFAERSSFVVRYRSVLRTPSRWLKSDPERSRYRVDRRGESVRPGSRLDLPYRILRSLPEERVGSVNPYSVGGRGIVALRRLIASLKARKIAVLLAEMPVSPDLSRFHEHGAEDYRRFEQAIGGLAGGEDVKFVNMLPSFPDTSTFVDLFHVNRTGRERFTQLLAEALRAR